MGEAHAEAIKDAVWREVDGLQIPFASPLTLWRMKRTHRAKDIPDQLFLRELLSKQGVVLDAAPTTAWQTPRLPAWLARLLGTGPR